MKPDQFYGAGFYVWRVTNWALEQIAKPIGKAIDAATELFDLDGDDHE